MITKISAPRGRYLDFTVRDNPRQEQQEPHPPQNIDGIFTGTVKFYNEEKGYGFIIQDDGSQDVFFHVSRLKMIGHDIISMGDRVEFNMEKDNRGRLGVTKFLDIQPVSNPVPLAQRRPPHPW